VTQRVDGSSGSIPGLGIIMLNTRFPRVLGDIGNPRTFPFPVRYEIVEQATVDRVVRADGLSAGLLDSFVEAAHRLAGAGVVGLTTSCGFVAICQTELARRCPLPMVASSLCQVPLVQAALPAGRRVGVITVDARKLTPLHLTAVGAPADTPVVGTESGTELTRVIEQDLLELDPDKACQDVLDAGEALVAKAPEVGAIVLECTNMAPYARALVRHVGLPVFDILGLLDWWYRSLCPPRFEEREIGLA
jgi:Asp/Glu/Hydantoin racemase